MTFGTDLWKDQIKNLEQYTQYGVGQMGAINEFIKAVSVAELEYGKALQKAAKPFRDEIKKMIEKQEKTPVPLQKAITNSTSLQAWDKLLAGTELLGLMHIEVAEQLSTERKAIKTASKDLETYCQERYTRIRKANDELKVLIDQMEKNHISYNREMKEMEVVGAKYKQSLKDLSITKEKQDRTKAEHEKQAQLTHDVSMAYRKSIAQVNEKKKYFYNDVLLTYLNDIQNQDEKMRILFCKESLMKFGTMIEATAPKTVAILKEAANVIQTIDPEKDSEILITYLKTGEEQLPDFHFSDTQEALKKKLALRTVSSHELKADVDSDDQIIASPAKIGRKKAMEKVKSLDKEIIDVEKQRQGIESLIGAYRDLPNGKEAHQDFLEQRADTEVKLNTLLMRKHRLHCYIAQIDNKAIPEAPALFGQGLSDSPTSYVTHSRQPTESPGNPTPIDLNPSPSRISNFVPLPQARISTNVLPMLGFPFSPEVPVEVKKVVALYDFEAGPDSQELPMKAGQVLELLLHQDDGWTKCKADDGAIGFVPTSYVQECD